MSNLIEVKVPDIGDFKNIPVIEVLVKSGDSINKEDALITLESDKATMEVPSPQSGVIKGNQGQGRRQTFRRQRGAARWKAQPLRRRRRKPRHPSRHPPPQPHQKRPQRRPSPHLDRSRKAIFTPKSWFWVLVPVATPPHSAPPISANKWC